MDEKIQEQVSEEVYRARAQLQDAGKGKFSEIRGICRQCSHAIIFRRELEVTPTLFCRVINYNNATRMQLDIMECNNFSQRESLSLDDLSRMALLIDARQDPGQYM